MKCPNCEIENSKVVDSRSVNNSQSVRRRRECLDCSYRFTTYEYISSNPVKVIKKTGEREEYDRSKLEKSFQIACKKRPISEEKIIDAIQNVENKIGNISNIEIQANKIGELVMIELKKIDSVSYIRFSSVYREFKDLSEFQDQINDLKNKF